MFPMETQDVRNEKVCIGDYTLVPVLRSEMFIVRPSRHGDFTKKEFTCVQTATILNSP